MTTQFSCLSDECDSLLLDASVIVNLNATGYADRILNALPQDILVPKPVVSELGEGAKAGHTDAIDLQNLLDTGAAKEFAIPESIQQKYVELVSGSTANSLGDGEAATIACAHGTRSWAAIDERKARRICAERYPHIIIVGTVDILSHDAVVSAFHGQDLSKAVLAALEVAHMQVQPHQMDWVVSQIPAEKLSRCVSLPRSVRERVARNSATPTEQKISSEI